MTDSMIERVAQAMYDKGTDAPNDPYVERWDNLRCKWQDTWRDLARASIKAMREPTEAMKIVGADFVYEGWASTPDGQKAIAVESWQAMIDEALK